MGYRVRLDDDSTKLVELVTRDPSKVLGKLYAAYILILVAEPDKSALNWLLDNARALDSLTGDNIAYAVFAERFTVKLKADRSAVTPDRTPSNLGTWSIDGDDTRDVSRLVKDGKFGLVVDGDELAAIYYGTDRVARQLGIVDKLPCLVLIDAIPAEKPCVIALDDQLTNLSIPLLRQSIAQFELNDGAKKIKALAQDIVRLQDLIEAENADVAVIQQQIDEKTVRIERMQNAIASGSAQDNLHRALQKYIDDKHVLEDRLTEFELGRDERLGEIDGKLDDLLNEYQRHPELQFSTIFKKKIRESGLRTKFDVGLAGTMNFLGSLLKPETLLKFWGLMHL